MKFQKNQKYLLFTLEISKYRLFKSGYTFKAKYATIFL